MFNPIEINAAARKASKLLGESGAAGRVEPGKVLWQSKLEINPDGEAGGFTEYFATTEGSIGLVLGETYTITTDSGTFVSVCREFSEGGEHCLFVGNGMFFGAEDTGERWLVCTAYTDGQIVTTALNTDCSTHISVSTSETIHPIDPKFIRAVEVINLADYGMGTESTTDGDAAIFAVVDKAIKDGKVCYFMTGALYMLMSGYTYGENGILMAVTANATIIDISTDSGMAQLNALIFNNTTSASLKVVVSEV